MIKVVVLGEIVGLPVVKALRKKAQSIKEFYDADLMIGNADGASDGYGILAETVLELMDMGFDYLTSGDLVFNKRNVKDALYGANIIRPYNLPLGTPGKGYTIHTLANGNKIAIMSLLGRNGFTKIFATDPYIVDDMITNKILKITPNVIVDFHGGTTSEIQSIHWLLSGISSVVVGTHPRVLTADARIIEEHTAVITGNGCCAGKFSIGGLSADVEALKIKSGRFAYSKIDKEEVMIQGVCITIDDNTGKAMNIETINKPLNKF